MEPHRKQWNIAMLGHKRVPSREGGVEIVVEALSTRMAALGHAVTCYNRKGHHIGGREFDTEALSEYRGVRIKTVPTLDRKGLAAITASVTAAVAAAFGRYDVVHFHAEGPCAMLWLPKLLGKRCIATVHGLDHRRAKWGALAKGYIMLGEKCAARFADEIIVLSAAVQEYFMATYGRRTRLIPNGVERPEMVPEDCIRQQYGLRRNDYILYLGRIVPEKGIHYLLEAFRSVKTDKKLVIAGGASDTGEYMQQLRGMAGQDDRVLFTGFVQGQLLAALYSNAYVYTLPSDLEGMPLSLLEAMSYGNCCLVSDIPECADVVEDKAVIFPRGDAAALARQLQQLCDDPQTVARYQAGAADFVCAKYDWDAITAQTLALYER